MQPPDSSFWFYEFGQFRLYPLCRVLWRGQEVMRLTPKVFTLLEALVEQSGKTVTKEALMRCAWGETIVEENNLTFSISVLRKALGDENRPRQFIVTVPGEGYRFVAKVRVVEEEDGEDYLVLASTRTKAENKPLAIRSIAVLPFQSLATCRSDCLLERSLEESLIVKLSKLEHIALRPLVGFEDLGTSKDSVAIGREFRVDSVLAGYVQKDSHRVRITARLLRTTDGILLLAWQFDAEFDDTFTMQDRVADEIYNSLSRITAGVAKAGQTAQLVSSSAACFNTSS